MQLLRSANCLDFTQYALLKMTDLLDKQEQFRIQFKAAKASGALEFEDPAVRNLEKMVQTLDLQSESNREMTESVGKRAQALFNHRRISDQQGDVSEPGGPLHDLLYTALKYSSDYDYEHYSAHRSPSAEGDQ